MNRRPCLRSYWTGYCDNYCASPYVLTWFLDDVRRFRVTYRPKQRALRLERAAVRRSGWETIWATAYGPSPRVEAQATARAILSFVSYLLENGWTGR